MAKAVFLIALLLGCTFQWIRFTERITDDSMWAHQAQYVQDGDPREFDVTLAYGHPGGPIIEGTILIHNTFGLPYLQSLDILMTVLDGFFIAATCLVCFLLGKDDLWWIPVFATLSFSQLYDVTTPPSALASLIVTFLCLYSIYIYVNRETVSSKQLIFWGVVSGISIATRADIGIVMTAAFAILLLPVFGWKKMVAVIGGACIVFCIFDPFMWFMPIQHITDLLAKIFFHYSDIAPIRITFFDLFNFSLLTFMSMLFGLIFIIQRKEMASPLPLRAIAILLITTVILYIIFATAHSEAARYFQPLVFIWEVFLPIFILSFISKINLDFLRTPEGRERGHQAVRISIIVLLAAYPAVLRFYAFSNFCSIDNCWTITTPLHNAHE